MRTECECRGWYAWINLMPPKPDDFHVVGDVVVGNPGIEPVLVRQEPQGINPAMLLLELHLVQRPGIWPQVLTCAQTRYDYVLPPGSPGYSSVAISFNGQQIAFIDTVDQVV